MLLSDPAAFTGVPPWFTQAIDCRPDHADIDVDGCRIHLRCWGSSNLPVLVFVHGGGAHSGWWDHIAPYFAQTHRVVALDLSGHGDSGHRSAYSTEVWAREVIAAGAFANAAARPTVVGHSMGGWVTATAAIRHGDLVDSIAVIDSPLRGRAPEDSRLRRHSRLPRRRYARREDVLARFIPVPHQDEVLPYVARHIATNSIHRVGAGGWDWKFDPAVFGGPDPLPEEQEVLERILEDMPCRVGYLRCELGVVPREMADQIRELLQLRGPFIELPESGHHPMLDQPLALISAIRTLVEIWSIS